MTDELSLSDSKKFQKFSLGTAQFGTNYGIGYGNAKKTDGEVSDILDFFYDKGGRWLDTAPGYGNADERLGRIGVSDFSIVTKLKASMFFEKNSSFFEKKLEQTLSSLKRDNLDCVLIHDIENVVPHQRDNIISEFQALKKMGLTKRIGISIYNSNSLNGIKLEMLDVVQAPLNPFDQNFINQQIQKLLEKNKISLHARSIFLQGLLLLNKNDRPNFFVPWEDKFKILSQIAQSLNISLLELCLTFAITQKGVERIILGAQNKKQLNEIFSKITYSNLKIPESLSSNDTKLIHPFNWKYL